MSRNVTSPTSAQRRDSQQDLYVAEADPEYKSRIEADQCTWQFSDALRPTVPQQSIDELPLFGCKGQEDLFQK